MSPRGPLVSPRLLIQKLILTAILPKLDPNIPSVHGEDRSVNNNSGDSSLSIDRAVTIAPCPVRMYSASAHIRQPVRSSTPTPDAGQILVRHLNATPRLRFIVRTAPVGGCYRMFFLSPGRLERSGPRRPRLTY